MVRIHFSLGLCHGKAIHVREGVAKCRWHIESFVPAILEGKSWFRAHEPIEPPLTVPIPIVDSECEYELVPMLNCGELSPQRRSEIQRLAVDEVETPVGIDEKVM